MKDITTLDTSVLRPLLMYSPFGLALSFTPVIFRYAAPNARVVITIRFLGYSNVVYRLILIGSTLHNLCKQKNLSRLRKRLLYIV